jgi:hypothetical protein
MPSDNRSNQSSNNIVDKIKNLIAEKGGQTIQTVTRISPYWGGKVASTVNWVGQKLGNPLPEKYYTETAQTKGGETISDPMKRLELSKQAGVDVTKPSSDPAVLLAQVQKGLVPSDVYKEKTGTNPPKDYDMNLLMDLYKKQGWTDENAIRADIAAGGWQSKVDAALGENNSSGGGGDNNNNRGIDINKNINDAQKWISENKDKASFLSEDDVRDIVSHANDVASAFEERVRQIAEAKYNELMAEAARQREEVTQGAEMRRRHARERESLYKGEYERRKAEEVSTIEKQREREQREFELQKDELAANWQALAKKFEAQARALGMSANSFVFGETRKLMAEFNSNLDKAWNKHKDVVTDLNDAVKQTIDVYNGKIDELEMKTRQALDEIDAWEAEQINNIRNMEGQALVAKLEMIADAANKADQYKASVQNAIDMMKLEWSKWLAQMQVQFALTAKYAAEDKITSAKNSSAAAKARLDMVQKAMNLKMGDVVPMRKQDGSISYYYTFPNPLTGEDDYVELTQDAQQADVFKKILTQPPSNPLDQYLQNVMDLNLNSNL